MDQASLICLLLGVFKVLWSQHISLLKVFVLNSWSWVSYFVVHTSWILNFLLESTMWGEGRSLKLMCEDLRLLGLTPLQALCGYLCQMAKIQLLLTTKHSIKILCTNISHNISIDFTVLTLIVGWKTNAFGIYLILVFYLHGCFGQVFTWSSSALLPWFYMCEKHKFFVSKN
jgi:hypothetical protein